MKIGELIDQLRKFDPNRVVVVSGYEGGYCDPIVCEVLVILGRAMPYEGQHSAADPWMVDEGEVTDVVCIARKNCE